MLLTEQIIKQTNRAIFDVLQDDFELRTDENLQSMVRDSVGLDTLGVQNTSSKRIRPLLCCLICGALSGDHQDALLAAAALEMLHNFSLVHDDIEDQSEFRHHRPSLWNQYGLPLSLNAGDYLFGLTYRTIHAVAAEMVSFLPLHYFDSLVLKLTYGQHLDMSFEQRVDVSEEEYMTMIAGKTVALIQGCFEFGALAAELNETDVERIAKAGELLGFAFQMQDDYLGIWGETAQTGKSVLTDVTSKKKTLPILYAVSQDEAFRNFWHGYNGSPDEVQQIADRIHNIGGAVYTLEKARYYLNEAKSILFSFPLKEPYRNELDALFAQLAQRQK